MGFRRKSELSMIVLLLAAVAVLMPNLGATFMLGAQRRALAPLVSRLPQRVRDSPTASIWPSRVRILAEGRPTEGLSPRPDE